MYKEVDEVEKAILDFNKAITILPSYAGLYTERGILLLQTDRIDEAITDFDKSLELFPLNPVAFRFRGESFKKKGQFEKAIEDFKMFLEIVPDAPVADIIRNEIHELTKLKRGVIWNVSVNGGNFKAVLKDILNTHILYNPLSHECYRIN